MVIAPIARFAATARAAANSPKPNHSFGTVTSGGEGFYLQSVTTGSAYDY